MSRLTKLWPTCIYYIFSIIVRPCTCASVTRMKSLNLRPAAVFLCRVPAVTTTMIIYTNSLALSYGYRDSLCMARDSFSRKTLVARLRPATFKQAALHPLHSRQEGTSSSLHRLYL